jgi:hypothetical protein
MTVGRKRILFHSVPALHLVVCIVITLAKLEWSYIVWWDFPVSILFVGLAWRYGRPLLWFGFGGTLWWYLISWIIWHIVTDVSRWLHSRRGPGSHRAP